MMKEYYENKTILITGSTGFVGKVILEKVLRTFSNVKTIYISINGSKGEEYNIYKRQIKDSQIFDQLKIQMGLKALRKLLRNKIEVIPIDFSTKYLRVSPQILEDLYQNLNIIINCSGTSDFNTRLDLAQDLNVRAPLLLLELAEKCHKFEMFCQMSTLFALSDRTGFIDEKMFDSSHDWDADYKKIKQMHYSEIPKHSQDIIKDFPNNYCYTKRMAEELLQKKAKVPLLIIRPSIIAASMQEPFPGWTDSMGMLGEFYTVAGLGIMRDLRINPKLISDQIPVDFVANQLLAAIPIYTQESRQTGKRFFLTHACSSSSNGVTWSEIVHALENYWEKDRFDQAVMLPRIKSHNNDLAYKIAFKLKSEIPSLKYYYLSKLIGTKNMRKKSKEILQQVEKSRIIGEGFSFFLNHEWVFDNASSNYLQKKLGQQSELNFDVSKIQWTNFVQNHAYGIKRYILNEEANMPSQGYHDARYQLFNPYFERILNPFTSKAFNKTIKTYQQTKEIVFKSVWVQKEIKKLALQKLSQKHRNFTQGLQSWEETDAIKEVEALADKMLKRIFSSFTMTTVHFLMNIMNQFFTNSYSSITVNQNEVEKLKELCNSRKGPVIFCPTHRSYVDFMVLSTILYFYGLEIPLICSGEDFLNIPVVADMLRNCGAFFMRRTFRGDELYKAVFYEYVRSLNKDKEIMEFFIEGTRSRTNKMISPKYGFMSVCSRVFFEKQVEDITFVPVTLNYTRTLEGETFPGELRGEQKVKETFSRILSGTQVLMMDLGTMHIDFCEPISLKQYTESKMENIPNFDPFKNHADQLKVNADLAHDIVFDLQRNLRMMPTNMVASLILLYRKGISHAELSQKMMWLGMLIKERGAKFNNDTGLPGANTIKIGLEHLKGYLDNKSGIYSPDTDKDLGNIIMLTYYRNPLNQIFFNEGLILVAMHSFGIENEWQIGINMDQLFEKSCFISGLLKREEVIKERITKENRQIFDQIIAFMIQKRVLIVKDGKVLLRTAGESVIIFIQSLIFPMIDSYYVTLIYALTFSKNKGTDAKSFLKNVQWLSELLFKQGSIQYFESCNQESIKNAMDTFVELGVIAKKGSYLELSDHFQKDESQIIDMLEQINKLRSTSQIGDVLSLNDPKKGLFRRSMMVKFPFMAKL